MYSKIEITGTIEVMTGMHIGASDGFAAIGAIDSPVAKDVISSLPYIPGSSLKGKMRSLLAKARNKEKVSRRDDDDESITRLFGAARDKRNKNMARPSRLIFSDSILNNSAELEALSVQSETEAKEENTINPRSGRSNPRQIERVIRGAKFPLNIIYNVDEEKEFLEDMRTLALGLELLRHDYIGGHGSRGYGKIAIYNIEVKCVTGKISEEKMAQCNNIIKGE